MRIIYEVKAILVIVKGLLLGKSLADIQYEEETKTAQAKYQVRALQKAVDEILAGQ